MSVTFFHTAEPLVGGWILECACGRGPQFDDRADAVKALVSWREERGGWAHCDDEMCGAYEPVVSPMYVGIEPVTVNLSNANARHVLEVLGVFDPDLYGDMELDVFSAALSAATPTVGEESRVLVRVGGEDVDLPARLAPEGAPVRWVDCGRDGDYDRRVLRSLSELAAQAREMHADRVCWA